MGRKYSLDDKYLLESGTVYLSGIQALVRLPIEQVRHDALRGLRTGAFISGYEGSPLGGYDLALQRASELLAKYNIHFFPGVNEDLAATAVMGSQTYQCLAALNPVVRPTVRKPLSSPSREKVDGVVGIWYGKGGPGLDRSGDAFRHANFAGTGENCGVLALAGDDHIAKSATIPHQSEFSFFNLGMPTLTAGNTQEVLDYGLLGIALSRYTGAWCGFKLATDVCDGGGIVEVSPERCQTVEPEFCIDGRPYRKIMNAMLLPPVTPLLEREVYSRRLEAARRFARLNGFNQIKVRHRHDRLGIVSAGKAYYDLMSALRNVGLDEQALERLGVRILKLGMVYPLEPETVDEFVAGLEQVLVVEEKRSFIEMQLREMLFNRPVRPAVYGKQDREGNELLPYLGELGAEVVAGALGRWLGQSPGLEQRLAKITEIESRSSKRQGIPPRLPTYCSGCPHNRSTYLLEGQIAGGGIGCHGMAALLGQETRRGIAYLSHMGSEGAAWIGMAPFTERRHIFQNLGDGTYSHSGRMAVLAAISSGVNITFKILFNGVVAMTGGQEVAGGLSIPALTRELEANGVKRIVLLTDDLTRYRGDSQLASSVELHYRDKLEDVLAELEKVPGTSAMIYDQMCAAEKRRRRNRGKMPKPVRRLMINERVCEGCGDCVEKSNCVSLRPIETEFGPKTSIHQSSCNADYTCALGDCPSFVSVMIKERTGLKRRPLSRLPEVVVEEPLEKVPVDGAYHVLMPGIGGTGVVTVNALLATAAVLDGYHVTTLDQTGLAQKGGAVVSHLTISPEPIEASNRIGYGMADLLLGFDVMGAAGESNVKCADPNRTVAVVDTHETPTGDSVRRGLTVLSSGRQFVDAINRCTRSERNIFADASRLAESLFGGHMHTNIFLLGVAYQAGLVPLRAESIEQAIRLNGVAVERNLEAFRSGRKYQQAPDSVLEYVPGEERVAEAQTLDGLIEHRFRELTLYQDAHYAERYRSFVEEVRRAEERVIPGRTDLTESVARYLYKLMAYKDEYEVARLLTDASFDRQVRETFEAPRKISFHLHPPILRALGLKKKLSLGPWSRPFLQVLAFFKALRGTPFDLFGWPELRRQEKALISWYRETVHSVLAGLSQSNYDSALEIARLPDQVRGYEQVKARSIKMVRSVAEEKLAALAQQTAA